MPEIWILKEEDTYSGDVEESMWNTEIAAQKEACSKIQDLVNQNWDLADSEALDLAREINDTVVSGNYSKAIRIYNSEEGNKNHGYFIDLYSARLNDIHDADDPEIYDYDHIDEEEEEEEEEPISSGPFVASSPGANCRGPCKSYSPDAYADQRDGTYECYQCKFMKSVFGH